MRKFLWILFAVIIAGVSCRGDKPSSGKDLSRPPVELNSAVDKPIATTGDVITYTVTIDRAPEAEVEMPEFGKEIGRFKVEDYGDKELTQVEGRIIVKRWYKLRADAVNYYIIPPIKLNYKLKSKPNETKQIQTSQIFIHVKSVMDKDMEDIIDIKPPIEWLNLILLIAAGLAAAALVAAGVAYSRRKKEEAKEIIIKPAAHEIALAKLNGLMNMSRSKPEEMQEFYFSMSEIFRAYLEERYNFPATDWTSEEIVPRLYENQDLADTQKEQSQTFFTNTDLVKFAYAIPAETVAVQELERAIQFVEATKEIPAEQIAQTVQPAQPEQTGQTQEAAG